MKLCLLKAQMEQKQASSVFTGTRLLSYLSDIVCSTMQGIFYAYIMSARVNIMILLLHCYVYLGAADIWKYSKGIWRISAFMNSDYSILTIQVTIQDWIEFVTIRFVIRKFGIFTHPYMLQSQMKSHETNAMPLDSSRELKTSGDEDCGNWSLSDAASSLGHLHVIGDTKTEPNIWIEHNTQYLGSNE